MDDFGELGQSVWRQARMRRRREHVPERQIVSPRLRRGQRFGQAVHRSANECAAGGQAHRGFDGQALAGQMHTVGAERQGDVETVVDGQKGLVVLGNAA